jgi:preprotein translocase subunit YajC
MNLLNILLMAQPAGGQQQGSPYSGIVMMVLLVAVFYFFFIRPQQKKAKEVKKFREALAKGDRIVTIGGIHGKVIEMDETTVVIETEGQGRLRLNKDAVNSAGDPTAMAQQK